MFLINGHLLNQWLCFSLDSWLDEASFAGSVDLGTQGHISRSTDGGVTLDALHTGGAAEAQAAHSTCRQSNIDQENLLLRQVLELRPSTPVLFTSIKNDFTGRCIVGKKKSVLAHS